VVYFSDKVVSENELQELEELSKILSTYKEKVHLKRQVSKCLWNSHEVDFNVRTIQLSCPHTS
jgi:hypothetical protein